MLAILVQNKKAQLCHFGGHKICSKIMDRWTDKRILKFKLMNE